MNNNILLMILIFLIVLNLIYLCKNMKSNFKNCLSFTSNDVYKCFSNGLNCSWGRLGCECPVGPAAGINGNLQLAKETMENIN